MTGALAPRTLRPVPRTFVFGDIHGDLEALDAVLAALPPLDPDDSLVFLGDYVDRGPDSAGVVSRIRELASGRAPCKVVALRGNHEDAWLRVIDRGWPEFVLPLQNGCLAALRSYRREAPPARGEAPTPGELEALLGGAFLPAEDVAWMRALPFFHEDPQAIYVHAGLVRSKSGGFRHPAETEERLALLWCRDRDFFANYRGKLVVFGHTATSLLPQELSSFTPEDPADMWAGPSAIGLDTGAGKGGFLTCLELPSRRLFTSPPRPPPAP